MSAAGQTISPDLFLLATISDELQIVMYQQRSMAGSKHNPKPKLMLDQIKKEPPENQECESFDSPEEFERKREQIIKGG
jgi:hypothetical protein